MSRWRSLSLSSKDVLAISTVAVLSAAWYLSNHEWAQPASDTVGMSYIPFAILLKHTFTLDAYGDLVGTIRSHGHEVSKSPIGTPLTVLPFYVFYALVDGHVTPQIVSGLGKLSAGLLTTVASAFAYLTFVALPRSPVVGAIRGIAPRASYGVRLHRITGYVAADRRSFLAWGTSFEPRIYLERVNEAVALSHLRPCYRHGGHVEGPGHRHCLATIGRYGWTRLPVTWPAGWQAGPCGRRDCTLCRPPALLQSSASSMRYSQQGMQTTTAALLRPSTDRS